MTGYKSGDDPVEVELLNSSWEWSLVEVSLYLRNSVTVTVSSQKHRWTEIFQECLLVHLEATLVALRLELFSVLSVIGGRTKEHP